MDTLPRGVTKEVLKEGTGAAVQHGQNVTVHCIGFGKNGDLSLPFWSTRDPGQRAFTFRVGTGEVIPGRAQLPLILNEMPESRGRDNGHKALCPLSMAKGGQSRKGGGVAAPAASRLRFVRGVKTELRGEGARITYAGVRVCWHTEC